MRDFSKGKIYIIRSHKTDDVYIGSTTQELSVRMAFHRFNSNTSTSKELVAHGDAYIELLELYPCANEPELLIREGFHIQENSNCVNRCIAGRTRKDTQAAYRASHIDEIKAYQAANSNKIKAYQAAYRAANIDKKKAYYRASKEKLIIN